MQVKGAKFWKLHQRQSVYGNEENQSQITLDLQM